jgi:hypothetical protein
MTAQKTGPPPPRRNDHPPIAIGKTRKNAGRRAACAPEAHAEW